MAEGGGQGLAITVTADTAHQFIDRYDTFLFDCDGVLWGCDHTTPFSGVASAINKLRAAGKKVLFVSNNSVQSRQSYQYRLKDLAGVDAAVDDVISVTDAAAVYLRDIVKIPETAKVYIIANSAMASELDKIGIHHCGLGPDPDPVFNMPGQMRDLLALKLETDIQAVLVGMDEYFSFNKIMKAASYLLNPRCHFIACNDSEKFVRVGDNKVLPITGTLVAAVMAASGRSPVVLGKPHAHLLQSIMCTHPDINLKRTIMIGDTIDTDVGFARQCDIASAVVLTGNATKVQVQELVSKSSPLVPNFILPALSDLGEWLTESK